MMATNQDGQYVNENNFESLTTGTQVDRNINQMAYTMSRFRQYFDPWANSKWSRASARDVGSS